MRGHASHWLIALLGGLLSLQAIADGATNSARMAAVRGGKFESVLPPAPDVKQVAVADFRLDRTPVTNGQFARFVQQHPE